MALSAAEELLRRRKAVESLEAWMAYRGSPHKPAMHHRLLIAELEMVERGDTRNLMFNLPPGSAKSTYGSVEFPAWYMGRNPGKLVLGCANTDELAEVFSRRVRNIVDTQEFRNVFGVSLSTDKTGVGNWVTSFEGKDSGEYMAAGVGAAIAGRRGDLGLIDDPVKSREHADSERAQESVWQWYLNDFLTRLKPGAPQIVIMTRWSENDLGGRILDRDGKNWKVISVPMEAQDDDPLGREYGDRLWPEYFTDEMVERAKQDTRSWWALYQQQPTAEDGDYFKREWFGTYDSPPKDLRIYGASDFAVTEGSGDFTEHGICGVDASGNLYVLDWWRGQKAADHWIDRMADMVAKHQPMCWFGEAGPIRRSIEPFLMKRLSEREAYCRVEWLPSVADKESRARGIQAMMAMGKVRWPRFAPWKTEVEGQLLKFPAGKHDDAVDVMSLFGRGLKFINASKGKPKELHYPNLGLPGHY
jgi:predicted phage terminase large subunit-like protein